MRNCAIAVSVLLIIIFAIPARASLFSEAWGILTDPLKIGEGTENIMQTAERTMIHLERIQKQLGQDTDRVLGRVDNIIGDTRRDLFKVVNLAGEEARSVTNNAFLRVSELQKEVLLDANQFVKCSTATTLYQIQSSLAGSLNQLGQRKPRIVFFGWVILSAEFDPVDIENPMESFRAIKLIYQRNLNLVKPEDHPSKIFDIYGEMQRLSDLTRCHYKNDTLLFEELYWTEIEFNRRERPWRDQVKL